VHYPKIRIEVSYLGFGGLGEDFKMRFSISKRRKLGAGVAAPASEAKVAETLTEWIPFVFAGAEKTVDG